ncbi:MAG: serine hydrolase, partial [Parabacteroides sp.]
TTLFKGTSNEVNNEYGFQYWIMNYKGMTIPYMSGMAGQYVFAIPEMNAVVVRLGRQEGDRQIWLDAAMDLIAQKTGSVDSK